MKNNVEKTNKNNIKILTRSGVLIALSAIGAMIKIQGTIAFDSMPGYFAALYINPIAGAFVATLGHLLTSVTSSFPLSLPMHLIVALEMGLFAFIFGLLSKKTNSILASIVAILLNGPIATYIASIMAKILGLPFNGTIMFNSLVIPLTIASAVNIIFASIIFKVIYKEKR